MIPLTRIVFGSVFVLAACHSGESASVLRPEFVSPFEGEWSTLSTTPSATLSLRSRGDSLFGTLRWSGQQVAVVGSGDASSFVITDDLQHTLILRAVSLDFRTLKARLDAGGSSTSLLMARSIDH